MLIIALASLAIVSLITIGWLVDRRMANRMATTMYMHGGSSAAVFLDVYGKHNPGTPLSAVGEVLKAVADLVRAMGDLVGAIFGKAKSSPPDNAPPTA
ncbi:hypothetical protein BST16_06700 [Mycobacterium asiaticum DSM 44297]|nr:hypothetical protein BST16_06700 [Mycobacterium asiaticum DSM 44297]